MPAGCTASPADDVTGYDIGPVGSKTGMYEHPKLDSVAVSGGGKRLSVELWHETTFAGAIEISVTRDAVGVFMGAGQRRDEGKAACGCEIFCCFINNSIETNGQVGARIVVVVDAPRGCRKREGRTMMIAASLF